MSVLVAKRILEQKNDALNDRAAEEWECLGLMSFHGAPWDESQMLADLTPDDVTQIAALINELAAERRELRALARAYLEAEKALRRIFELRLNEEVSADVAINEARSTMREIARAFLAVHEPVAQPPERTT